MFDSKQAFRNGFTLQIKAHLFRLLVAVGFCLSCSTTLYAQGLPVVRAPLSIELILTTENKLVWKIGSLVFELPPNWVDKSRPNDIRLLRKEEGVASFVLAKTSIDAQQNAYSLVLDPMLPNFLLNIMQWNDCVGNPARVIKTLSSPKGKSLMFTECAVELPPPSRIGTAIQIAIYSHAQILQIYAVGSNSAIDELKQALSLHSWREN